jgi:peptide/nickel transport system ATP-binding protein
MYAGKIVESGSVFSIFEEPLHPYTSGLLKSVVSIDEFKRELESIPGMVPDMANPPSGCRFHPRCEHAKEICRIRDPSGVVVDSNHYVSCWLRE